MQKSVDRTLHCQPMEDIDKALGRPENPLEPTSTYSFEAPTLAHANHKAASGHWRTFGKMCIVTDEGRLALAEYLHLCDVAEAIKD